MRCVPAHHFTVAKARTWRSAIDDDPVYQRASDAWTLAQQQRFIDSLLNGYDVPKIYLHDLRGRHPTKVYAVVDGKQRLTAIWAFLDDGFPLASDFRIESVPAADVPDEAQAPAGAMCFSELDPGWRKLLLGTYLSVVLIRAASEADIDELFTRLNDGSPLTPAERRNALGGEMAALVRDVADGPALRALLAFPDVRGAFRELAAAILALEYARRRDNQGEPDLSSSGLDSFVRAHRRLGAEDRESLLAGVDRRLAAVARDFRAADPRLSTAAGATNAVRGAWAAIRPR